MAFGELTLRRVLREDFVWRQAVKWWVGTGRSPPHLLGRRGSPPHLLYRPFHAIYMPGGSILVADREAHQVVEVTRDYNIVWEFGRLLDTSILYYPEMVDYDPDLGRVLISDTYHGRVLEVDYKTKAVVRELSATSAGPLGKPRAKYNPRTKRPMIADWEKHFVCECEWDGTIVWSFGTYGTPGTPAEGRLNSPTSVSYWRGWYPEQVIISDYYNHRVFIYRPGVGITRQFVVPYPQYAFAVDQFWGALSEFDRNVVFDSDGLLWVSPWFGNYVFELNPDTLDLLVSHHELTFELDFRVLMLTPPRLLPYTRYLFSSASGVPQYKSFSAGESAIAPFYAMGARRCAIYCIPGASATLEVLALKPSNVAVDVIIESDRPTPTWVTIDSISIPAGTLGVYYVTQPNGVMAVRLTLASAGVADCWVNIE